MEAGINHELDLLAEALHASVSLDDTDGRVLGYSVQADDADPARVAAILTRQVPAAVSARQRRYGVDHATDPVHLPADPEHGMVARVCVPVRHQHRTLALLWVLETTTALAPDEVQIAVRTAARLADRLARTERPRPRATPGELLRRLSRGENLTEDESISSVAPHSLSITVAVPVLPSRAGPAGWSVREVSELERSLAALLRTNRAFVAAYAEPDHAAALHLTGPTDNDNHALPPDAAWSDVGLHALASALPAPTTPGILAPLLKHDASGPMLLTTLETYLDLGGDAQRTATALHLHRTTLYYRVHRSAKLLRLDLKDGMTRTQLHLELKRLRLQRGGRRIKQRVATVVARSRPQPKESHGPPAASVPVRMPLGRPHWSGRADVNLVCSGPSQMSRARYWTPSSGSATYGSAGR